jgi:uncharacterized protein (TIGR00369 family)
MTWEIAHPTDELLALVRAGMESAVPFASHAGVVLTSVNDGEATAALPELATALNHVRTVHAGALFTLAETASGAAMAGAFATVLGEIRPVVSKAEIAYQRPAKGPLTARARIDRDAQVVRDELGSNGRVEFAIGVEVLDASDRTVATFAATWVLQRTRSPS